MSSTPFHNEFNSLYWGNTRSKEGSNRRVCVTTIPRETTVTHLQKFFGATLLEGISILDKQKSKVPIAFVQFKRTADYTAALLRNQETFLDTGYKITVRPYIERALESRRRSWRDSLTPTKRLKSRSRSRERIEWGATWGGENRNLDKGRDRSRDKDWSVDQDRNRDRNRDRGRSSSLSRARTSDRGRIVDGNSSRANGQNRAWSKENTSNEVRSNPFNRDDIPDLKTETMRRRLEPSTQTFPPNSHSFGSSAQVLTFPPSVPQQQHISVAPKIDHKIIFTSPAHQPMYTPVHPLQSCEHNAQLNLPSHIELILKLVIEQKTARNLSSVQVQSVLAYFDSERKIIESGINSNFHATTSNGVQQHTSSESGPANNSTSNGQTVDPRFVPNSNSNQIDPRLKNSEEELKSGAQEIANKIRGIINS